MKNLKLRSYSYRCIIHYPREQKKTFRNYIFVYKLQKKLTHREQEEEEKEEKEKKEK